jgi:cellulose synthase/poly-beta-1,6-N-acetylglucosamine synthase-like glycosyltransferase
MVVIDDGSDDRTAKIIDRYVGDGTVLRHSRRAPEARQGKGRALNSGLRLVRAEVERLGLAPSRVIVGVLDADGRMTPNALPAVAQGFASDPSVGGVQLAVRIRNYRENMLLTIQDHSFWAVVALNELGRNVFGSAAMGGNGQFIRLSTLVEMGEEPWTDSLTEDLDLGITISVLGWRSIGVAKAYVTQQGVKSLGRLLRQWTRWAQGTMVCGARIPELVRSRYISNLALLEILGCLATPWVAMVWSVTEQYLGFEMLTGHAFYHMAGYRLSYRIVLWAQWYVLAFMPSIFWTWVYLRRTTRMPLWKAWLVSHLLLPWSWLSLLTTWPALYRIVRGRNSWVKTSREVEDPIPASSPTAA